jgi:peptidoglycan/LPS O-acetylase OafA/YrhL
MGHPTRFFNSRFRSYRDVKHSHGFYHPELDALRFFAFLAVFFHHALPRNASFYINGGIPPAVTQWLLAAKEAGAFGLDLFFALSAYLITELLLREHAKRGTFSVSAFYIRRALRIWPLYFTFLAATVFIMPTIFPRERFGPEYIVSFALFSGNWVCATLGIPFSVASPLWSISVEEQFYLGWPLLLLLFGVNRLRHLAVAMMAVALATRALLAVYDVEHPGVWCNTFARLDSIALGATLASLLGGRAPRIKRALRLVLCGVAFASWLLIAKFLGQDGPSSVATYAVSALASVALLIAVLQDDAQLLRFPPFSWLVYLGRISYGLYVFHLFALALISQMLFVPLLGIQLNFELRLILSFLLTVILAAASYRWLEQPFLKLKKRFTYDTAPSAEPDSRARNVESPVAADLARAR